MQIHKWITRVAGLFCLLIGVVGVLGWHFHTIILLQIIPDGPVMRYNTSLGFLLSGASLLCLSFRTSCYLVRYLGLIMFAFVFTMFIQIPLGIKLGIDTFFTDLLVGPISPEYATSPAVITLLIFMLAGITFVLLPSNDKQRFPTFTLLTLALLIWVLGCFGLLGFIVPIQTNLFHFLGSVDISFPTSLGAVILGWGLHAYILVLMLKYQRITTWTQPYIWGMGILIFSLLVTYALYIENVNIALTLVVCFSGILFSMGTSCLIYLLEKSKQNGEELRQSEEKFRIFIETTSDWVWAIDINRKLTFSNNSIQHMLGYFPHEIIGTDFLWLITDDTREKTENEFAAFREKKLGWVARLNKWKHKNGEIRWLESSANPLFNQTGNLLGYRGTERDVTERVAVSKIKNEFVAMVSHELRTPLTSIKGALALIIRNLNMTPEKISQLLAIALSNCDRLIALVNDILNLEKLEAGKIEIHLMPVEVATLIADSINENKQFAEKFGKKLIMEHAPPNIKVFSDPARVLQVLTNLISNAVKFSPPNGKVYIKVEDTPAYARFSVRDEGPGIPKDFQTHIFEKFMRANTLETSAVPGTGLGLSISKNIIQRLGGTIHFMTKQNVGTTFYFDLPKYYDVIPLIHPVIDKEKTYTLLVFSQDHMMNKGFCEIVKSCGFVCENFAHFEDVRTALQERQFGGLMLDLDNFNADNINFLKRICKARQFPIPLILVSSDQTEKTLQDSRLYNDFPVLGWLKKPINTPEIQKILEKLKNQIYAGKATVLYVDHDRALIETVKTLLTDHVQIRTAVTLAEARRILEQEPVDLLLLSMYLPDGLGSELLPAVNCKTSKKIPVVVFSIDEDTSRFKGLVDHHLVKARTTNQELIDTVLSVLKSQRVLQKGI